MSFSRSARLPRLRLQGQRKQFRFVAFTALTRSSRDWRIALRVRPQCNRHCRFFPEETLSAHRLMRRLSARGPAWDGDDKSH